MKILTATQKVSESLTERVYKELREAIITGRIVGGTRLVETTLAEEMQVSRTPVREALHQLGLEGLLHSIPRAGYIVEEMSDHDIQDLFTTRMAIEQLAANWAIEKITSEEFDHLEMNLKMSDKALKSGMTNKMAELDMEFHRIIYKASRSKSLFRICQNLSDHTLKYRIALIHIPDMAKKTRDDHLAIFNALLTRDPEKVNEAIQLHLQNAKKDLIMLLERVRQESFIP